MWPHVWMPHPHGISSNLHTVRPLFWSPHSRNTNHAFIAPPSQLPLSSVLGDVDQRNNAIGGKINRRTQWLGRVRKWFVSKLGEQAQIWQKAFCILDKAAKKVGLASDAHSWNIGAGPSWLVAPEYDGYSISTIYWLLILSRLLIGYLVL